MNIGNLEGWLKIAWVRSLTAGLEKPDRPDVKLASAWNQNLLGYGWKGSETRLLPIPDTCYGASPWQRWAAVVSDHWLHSEGKHP